MKETVQRTRHNECVHNIKVTQWCSWASSVFPTCWKIRSETEICLWIMPLPNFDVNICPTCWRFSSASKWVSLEVSNCKTEDLQYSQSQALPYLVLIGLLAFTICFRWGPVSRFFLFLRVDERTILSHLTSNFLEVIGTRSATSHTSIMTISFLFRSWKTRFSFEFIQRLWASSRLSWHQEIVECVLKLFQSIFFAVSL